MFTENENFQKLEKRRMSPVVNSYGWLHMTPNNPDCFSKLQDTTLSVLYLGFAKTVARST